MPNRIIKESIRTSYDINDLNWFEEVTFYRLLTYADDYGRFQGDPRVMKGAIFPLKEVEMEDFTNCLTRLAEKEMILFYMGDDKRPYGIFPTWDNHQNRRAKHSKFPEPPKDTNQFYADPNKLIKSCESNRGNIKSYASRCNHVQAYVPEESRNRGVEESGNRGQSESKEVKEPEVEEPELKDVKEFGNMRGITPDECETYWYMRKRDGWLKWSKGAESYHPIKDWKSDLTFLHRNGALRGKNIKSLDSAPNQTANQNAYKEFEGYG